MNSQRTLLKNTFWNISSYLYLLIAAVISVPFTLTGLGEDYYARYLVVNSLMAILISLDLGIPSALIRNLAQSPTKDHQLIFRRALPIVLLVAFVLGLTGYLAILVLSRTSLFSLNSLLLYQLGAAVAAYIIVNHILSLFAAVPQGRQDFGIVSVRAFVAGTGNTFLAAAVALSTHDLFTTLWVQTFSSLFALFLLTLYLISQYGLKAFLPAWQKTSLNSLLQFGFPIQLANLAPQLQANLSRVISTAFLSTHALTALGIAQSLTFKGMGIFAQITSALFPSAAKLSHDKLPTLRRLINKLSLLFISLAALTGLAIYYFGTQILTWWLGDFTLATTTSAILLAYSLFVLVLSPAPFVGTVLTASGRPWIVTLYSWLELGLELLLMLFLVRLWGVIGIPAAAVIAQACITPLFLAASHKALK